MRFTLLALVMTALVSALATLPGAAQMPQPITVHVGVGPVDTGTPIFYASEAGIYKKYGLDVDLVKVPNGATTVSAIEGGTLDLGQGSTLAAVTAFAKGLPMIVIGGLAFYRSEQPDFALLVMADSTIKTPKDLEGQTMAAVSLVDQNSLATFAWLDRHGVDRSKIKYVEIPASATLAAMEQGRVVGATMYEPFFTEFMATGKTRILGYPDDALGKRFAVSILFGNPAWVASHPDLVNKFLRATQEAAAYVGAHENETPQIAAAFTGADPSKLANVRHGLRGVYLSPSDIQPMIDAAAKYGIIPKVFPAQQMICGCALKR